MPGLIRAALVGAPRIALLPAQTPTLNKLHTRACALAHPPKPVLGRCTISSMASASRWPSSTLAWGIFLTTWACQRRRSKKLSSACFWAAARHAPIFVRGGRSRRQRCAQAPPLACCERTHLPAGSWGGGRSVTLPLTSASLAIALSSSRMGALSAHTLPARAQGICLRNCRAYGCQTNLRSVLLTNPKLIVSREAAKEYPFVKMCLILVFA
jgi:hypothetical protein